MREQAGMTLEEAAVLLDKTKSALQRVEKGETRLDVHLARSMMDKYDFYDPNLLDEARKAYQKPWIPRSKKDYGYVDVETAASEVNEFAALVVPGLLQVVPYIDAVLATGPARLPHEARAQREIRLARQQRLTDTEWPLTLNAVVDEAAIRREIGGPVVMRQQVRHLMSVAALPTVNLQVLPFRRGAHHSLEGGFVYLTFPSPEEQPLLYVAHLAGSSHIDDDEAVCQAKAHFERLRTAALSPTGTVELLERLGDELYGL
nr:Putative DNA-binding protein [Kibdelosporangium sp. MJ126-NF4]CTQ88893.1 Putative DNA-binding protein [Kibdelosporangium sp. MJ126-NF4]